MGRARVRRRVQDLPLGPGRRRSRCGGSTCGSSVASSWRSLGPVGMRARARCSPSPPALDEPSAGRGPRASAARWRGSARPSSPPTGRARSRSCSRATTCGRRCPRSENVAIALRLAGPRRARARGATRRSTAFGLAGRAATSAPPRSRAASSSGSRSPPRPRASARLVLADEPTGELDERNETIVLEALRELRDHYGSTVVVVTHSERVATAADRVIEIRDGRAADERRRDACCERARRLPRRGASSYGAGEARVSALAGVDFEIGPGEPSRCWGRSGSGKTTLLHVLGGLVAPTSGTVGWKGEPLSSLDAPPAARARARGIAYVFQGANLLPHFTACENVAFAARARVRRGGPAPGPEELLALVGLADEADALPAELSGGEAQRVAIARALAQRPELLLCDEPTGHLDSDTGERVLDLIEALQAGAGLRARDRDPRRRRRGARATASSSSPTGASWRRRPRDERVALHARLALAGLVRRPGRTLRPDRCRSPRRWRCSARCCSSSATRSGR